MITWSEITENFYLAQRSDKFKFGTDAVLLSWFSNIKKNHNIVDLCSGTGVVGFLSYLKNSPKNIKFIDIDNDMIELSKLTVEKNNLPKIFDYLCYDIKDLSQDIISNNTIDYITVNPPYFKENSGKINKCENLINARHTYTFSLDTLFYKSYRMLKDNGKIALIHRSEYLSDIIYYMKKNNIEPKRITFVHSYQTQNAKHILIEGMKNKGVGVLVSPPLVLYKEKNIKSDDFEEIQNSFLKNNSKG